jgi:hypothetical protein
MFLWPRCINAETLSSHSDEHASDPFRLQNAFAFSHSRFKCNNSDSTSITKSRLRFLSMGLSDIIYCSTVFWGGQNIPRTTQYARSWLSLSWVLDQ